MDGRLTHMAPKEAIARAKSSVADLFADERIDDIRLEEIRFDDRSNRWLITVGFERPARTETLNGVSLLLGHGSRAYKVVSISDDTGQTVAVTNWEHAGAS